MKTKVSVIDRFWAKVEKVGRCWIWKGAKLQGKTSRPYGIFNWNGKTRTTHRISFELHKGKIPEGAHVLHKCDTHSCVNPKHLFLGNRQINMADMTSKNRQARGEGVKRNVITTPTVIKIKALRRDGFQCCEIIKLLKLKRHLVYAVCSGKTWRHVKLDSIR